MYDELAQKIVYFQHTKGLPYEIFFMMVKESRDLSKDESIWLLMAIHLELRQHKINSGASEKTIERTKESQKKEMERFLQYGEIF